MRTSCRSLLSGPVALAAVALGVTATGSGCSKHCSESLALNSPSPAGGDQKNSGAAAERAISEADVIQLDREQNWIYAMSRSGSLAIVDASKPRALTLLGKAALSGEPFEMYRRGNVLLTMSNHGVTSKGDVVPPVVLDDGSGPAPAASTSAPLPPPDENGGALVSAVDVSDAAHITTLGTFKIPGEIADSRIVGDVLYVATYENATCWNCQKTPQTLVTTFDIANPSAPKQIEQIGFTSGQPTTYSNAWATPWKRSIIATSTRLYVGGLAENPTATDQGVIQVLDITDPSGHLTLGAKIVTAGPIMSRWQMDEYDGVLRVISQRGAGRTPNGDEYPDIDTFRIESTQSIVRVGHTTLTLPRQEGLKTVRFDGARAYAITFNQTDPLFTIDLTNPQAPQQKGELHMPGWVYHLEPRGDRLLGLGLDRQDRTGNLNVSLFDVSDMAAPMLVQRQSFGPKNAYEDYQITNAVMAEDQDRIQKAFSIFDDGLITVPFSGLGSGSGTTCEAGSGIQLLEWSPSSLAKRGAVTVMGNARRAIRRDSETSKELIAVSDSNMTSFSIDDKNAPVQTADVTIGKCVARERYPRGGVGGGGDWEGHGSGSSSCN